MALPLKSLPVIERWDCHQCGACCRGSLVPLSADDLARLRSQKWDERPEFRGVATTVRTSWFGDEHRLAQREDGRCVFLADDGACLIHKEFGAEAKPFVCRMFPLQVVPRDGVALLTIRRACPSAAADKGRPVDEHLDEARAMVRGRDLIDSAPEPPAIKPGESRNWRVAKAMLLAVERLLTDQRFPPVRRLVHALTFARLVEAAKTQPLNDGQLLELFGVLESAAPDETGDLFSKRPPPSSAGAVLFRQTAAEFIRLHPAFRARPSWGERLRLTWAAWKFVRGRGKLPSMSPPYPEATFEQLEQPLGPLDPAVVTPLARLFETTAVSGSYALAERGDWSMVESIRMLTLLYPVGLWMLRWLSVGRSPLPSDMPELISALDRGQGFASLSGYKQRRRVQVLAQLGDLERLVAWYGR
ncbi:MAG TPA: YkgJ family cysteine cluster protein [Pirellulaceae bacterium]|nr:YkgJ family cysteine cluster protein [Pirellulaceae bacterium]